MIIHKLHLTSFGKFQDKTITFTEGFNYIYGKNEAGKSTIMAFIKAMFYGFSGRGPDGDRKKYMPWSGGTLAGEMEVTLQNGRRILISRTAGKTPAQDTLTVLDAITGEAIPLDIEAEIGLGENAFLKTLFLRQLQSEIGADDELTDKLLNLAGSGNADTGYEDAIETLRSGMRFYKHLRGDGGTINTLRRKITALSEELETVQAESRTFFRSAALEKSLHEEIEALKARCTEFDAALSSARAGAAMEELRKALQHQNAMTEGEKQAAVRVEELLNLQKTYKALENDAKLTDLAAAEPPTETLREKEKAIRNKKAGIICAAIGCLLSAVLFMGRQWILAFVAAAAAILSCGFIVLAGRKYKATEAVLQKIEDENKKRKEILMSLGCETIEDYMEKMAEKMSVSERITAAKEKLDLLQKAKIQAEEAVQKARDSVPKNVTPSSDDADDIAQKKAEAEVRLAEKLRKKAEVEGFLKGSRAGRRTADMILSERSLLEEELLEAEKEYAAYALAAETLEEVFGELSRDFTPRISQAASRYLSMITGQNEELLLDKKYAVTMGRDMHRPLKAFSGGTMDQAFLAVRLALGSLVLQDTAMPIFLDDSLMQYDDERTENTCRLLRKLAEERQIFWFSCKMQETENINRITL